MDVYFDDLGAGTSAYFNLPALSVGGLFGNNAVDMGYMKLNQTFFRVGYKKDGTYQYGRSQTNYGTMAHEMFHFVQRCYVPKAVSSKWFDESTAAYYDAVFQASVLTDPAQQVSYDENYTDGGWMLQFALFPGQLEPYDPYDIGGIDLDYCHLVLIDHLMKQDGEFLKKAYSQLQTTAETGEIFLGSGLAAASLTSWTKILYQTAYRSSIGDIAMDYFAALFRNELMGKGFEPWKIWEDLVYDGGKVYGQVGEALNVDDWVGNETRTISYTIPAYGVHIFAVNPGKLASPTDFLYFERQGEGVLDISIECFDDEWGGVYVTRGSEEYTRSGAKWQGNTKSLIVMVNLTDTAYTGGWFGGTREVETNLVGSWNHGAYYRSHGWPNGQDITGFPTTQSELYDEYIGSSYSQWNRAGVKSRNTDGYTGRITFLSPTSVQAVYESNDGEIYDTGAMTYDPKTGVARGKDCVLAFIALWDINGERKLGYAYCRVFYPDGRPQYYFILSYE